MNPVQGYRYPPCHYLRQEDLDNLGKDDEDAMVAVGLDESMLRTPSTSEEGDGGNEMVGYESEDARISCEKPRVEKVKGGKVARVKGLGHEKFGFVKANKSQLIAHLLQAALIGATLRLLVFPQASLAVDSMPEPPIDANTTSTDYREYHRTRQLAFLFAFGITKAFSNVFVGRASDLFGRKFTHIVGWIFGMLMATVLISSKTWSAIIIANILLGAQQAAAWSSNIFMITDILGPRKRAVSSAMSNCTSDFSSVAAAFLAAGLLDIAGYNGAFVGALVLCMLGAVVATMLLEDTSSFVAVEVAAEEKGLEAKPLNTKHMTALHWGTLAKRTMCTNPSTAVICLTGVTSSMVTGLVWGLALIWGTEQGMANISHAALSACYIFPKGVALIVSGYFSDRWMMRKPLLMGGLLVIIIGLLTSSSSGEGDLTTKEMWARLLLGMTFIGVGTGLIYPVMSAAVGDHTPAMERASALGVFRFWKDIGYAFGGLIPGAVFSPTEVDSTFVASTLIFSLACIGLELLLFMLYTERYPATRKKGGDVVDSAL
eukprot:TRINITY_DN4695_c0_g1_i1.p1 TRINITY_DN4695_c0_g1~~TRINITY_DN4695_c0_g1_i1.p1  ORF type:complete len:544 (+),score=129.77 TRINITY_DN4695_c0_g1_i1:198-1829(+)